MTAQLKVFALTGGIGSGKSTVAGFWREAGLPVVEADQLARVAVQKGSTTLLELQRVFGAEMLLPDGNLDRKALGGLVFADPVAREQLNAIVHPEVQRLAQRRFAELSASGEELAAYEIPLLFETGQQARFRPVVVVSASLPMQLARAARRDGEQDAAISARISAQFPLQSKVAGADYVIDNNGSLADLRLRALEVLRQVRAE